MMVEDLSEKVIRVASFSEGALEGNPAGVYVCGEERFPPEEVMQETAALVGYSETAFVAGARIRYFTPVVEVPLCGHATLAAAWVMGERRRTFVADGGTLETWREGDMVWMDFPEVRVGEVLERVEVLAAMGLTDVEAVVSALPSILVEMETERQVLAYQSQLGGADIGRLPVQGVAVTARAPEGRAYDFVSRYFAPGVGIAEDPVTGLLHCALAPYWAGKLGKREMVGYQASDRGGFVHVRVDAEKPGRVLVGGFVRGMDLG